MSGCYDKCPDGSTLKDSLCVSPQGPPISAPGVDPSQLPATDGQQRGHCQGCPKIGCVVSADGTQDVIACAAGLGPCVVPRVLGAGDIAAIALGIALGIILIGSVVWACVRAAQRRRRGYRSTGTGGSAVVDFFEAVPNLFAAIGACFE